jgi:hypothetical protein
LNDRRQFPGLGQDRGFVFDIIGQPDLVHPFAVDQAAGEEPFAGQRQPDQAR